MIIYSIKKIIFLSFWNLDTNNDKSAPFPGTQARFLRSGNNSDAQFYSANSHASKMQVGVSEVQKQEASTTPT